ncbi:50S ribosomal protein L25 [Buchnera aphidicola (Hyadaphis tataricae)]|uniref:Large ribosomal subunit protein bL25 n=1 Tax=Buchnera aphidicola (Hyadaphis tataricae) TaxID=1241859 RepID=A0A4D6YAP9_9GAMM|nr:50S ribosomal protein L25 [Buchnera aphidicola]QCI21455.1 50S ribosomal protein L25 [Buchnera aphidicola (Hyadaphis tataricae)]
MLILNAEKRILKGKSFSRKLRLKNRLPGVLYGLKKNVILITLDHNVIFNWQKKLNVQKEDIFLIIDSKKYRVKVQDIQKHVFKPKLLHIDFLRIIHNH